MNKPLRKVGMVMLALIVLLLGNASYIQVINSADYAENPRNLRVLYDQYSRKRGQIVGAADGITLAGSKKSHDRFNYLRTYPYGPMYGQVIGFQSLRYGTSGIEQQLNDFLNGSDPRLFGRRLADIFTNQETKGGSVRLTLRHKVQQAAYQAMVERGYTGAVVAMVPDTGEIVAMVSTPSFDPAPLASHDPTAQEKAWNKYTSNPAKPMVNRAIQTVYPPGSTFKLVVAAAALENGADAQTQVTAQARIPLPNSTKTLPNYGNAPCPDDTLKAALAHSCNTAFAKLAGELGPETLRKTAQKFGIGMDDLQIPMPVATSSLGPMSSPAAVYQSAIGQRDVRMTPLQVAMISSTIANGGVAMKPFLVKELLAPNLSTVEEHTEDELTGDAALSQHNAEVLTDMMIASESNTGGGHKVPDLTLASKTGTAEHGQGRPPHGWYTAFGPADNPEIAVAVVVEDGGGQGMSATGSSIAAEVGRIVINTALGKR